MAAAPSWGRQGPLVPEQLRQELYRLRKASSFPLSAGVACVHFYFVFFLMNAG